MTLLFLQERVDDLRESVRSVFEFYYKPQFKTSSGKITKYEHLKRASRATGKVLAELENPPTVLPEFIHIWKWFTDLSRTRSSGFQVEPLTHPMMRAYFDLMLIRASPIEIDVLTIIDDEYLALTRAVAGEKNG